MLASQLPLPKHFAWQTLLLQGTLLALYQPALPFWNTLLFLLLLCWQSYCLHQQQVFSKQQINWLIAPLLLLLLLQVRQLGVLNLMLHILLLAAIGRGFTLKQRHDAVQLIWVQYFALTCAFIFYQQIALALLIFALLGLNLYLQHRLFAPAKTRLQPKRLALLTLFTLPLWLGLFLLFPRLPPLWQMPNQNIASSGLSDRLDPGSIERLVQSDALAFRVSFQTARPIREDWYWRAKVYEDFDGRSWQVNARFNARQTANRPQAGITDTSALLQYQILAEPSYQQDLYSLGLPVSWPATLRARPAALVANSLPLTQRMSYGLSSKLTAVPLGSVQERQLNLQQHSANPQTRQFGQQLARQYQGNAADIVRALTAYFQQQAFFYSLTPPRLGTDAIDQFLFESRIGFCSHYASATAVILRAAGIPARVVGGYQGGEWQQSQQYLLVRQREAHAWVEYLVENSWQRFDPTAAIAPERILAGLEQTLNLSDRALLSGWQDNWLGQLALQWSHLDYLWSVWVLGFNQQDQQQFWQRLLHWQYWPLLLSSIVSLSLLSLSYWLWLKWSRLHRQQYSALRVRSLLCKTLGGQPAAGVTVSSWLSALAKNHPQQAAILLELQSLYERSVFANEQAAEQMLLHKLKQHRRLLRKNLT